MNHQELKRSIFPLLVTICLLCGSVAAHRLFARSDAGVSDKNSLISMDQRPSPSPTPTASPREELPQDSDEVIKVETNLTSIFFTAADRNKRFVSTLKAEDIRL